MDGHKRFGAGHALGPAGAGDSWPSAVRDLHERAVPGLGGVRFGKQLFLAALGVAVAERARECRVQVSNIEVANAIEALACWLTWNHGASEQSSDGFGEALGKRKFADRQNEEITFRNLPFLLRLSIETVQNLPPHGGDHRSVERRSSTKHPMRHAPLPSLWIPAERHVIWRC